MPKYLDPKADVVFKKIFADHPHLLISFLNAILPLPPDRPIVSIEYLPIEQIPEIPVFKRTIADVRCKDKLGRVFIVEMQIDWTDSFKQRLLFGTSQAIVKQLHKGQMYQLLQPVYGVSIIADVWNAEDPTWYHHYRLVKTGEKQEDVIEHLQLLFIELPKFKPHSKEEKQLRLLWLRFLREIDEKTTEVSPELLDVSEIQEAVELAQQSAYTPAELSAYELYWDSVRTERTLLQGRYDEGKIEGRAGGIAEERAKALQEKKEIARNLQKHGMTTSIISSITGLPEAEILSLQ